MSDQEMTSGPMRVAFLATAIGGGGGMERFARELLRALGRRTDVELVAVVSEDAVRDLGLTPGSAAVLAFKASAVRVF